MYLGSFAIDDTCTFYANAHTPSTGAAVDADAAPGYRVYEDETGTPILTGSMALLDDANTVGFYSEQITLSAANGFEAGKSYCIRGTIVVGGVTGTFLRSLQIGAKVNAGTGSGFTSIPWNAAWDAEVESEATDALNAYDPPTRAELTSDVNSVLAALVVIDDFLDTEVAAIKAVTDRLISNTGQAQGGTSTTIRLAAGASSTDNIYKGQVVYIYSGPGAGQARMIESYTGATRTVNLTSDTWWENPDATSLYVVFPMSVMSLTLLESAVDNSSVFDVLTDTNELQTDWANGGRLDLLLDLAAATLTAAGVRTALGLGSANLDTQLDALPTAIEGADALLDRAAAIETGLTLRQAVRLIAAASAGKLSGAATNTVTIRNAVQDSKDRIVATVDADGNRSAITTDVT